MAAENRPRDFTATSSSYGPGDDLLAKEPPLDPSLKPQARRFLCERTKKLREDKRFRAALQAIQSKEKLWCKESHLTDALTILAGIAVIPEGGTSRKTLEKLWSLETGKTWKALKEFPARVRCMADEVERVSRGHFFDPQKLISVDTLKGKYVKRQFAILPGSLRWFAAYIERRIEKLPANSAPHLPPAKRGRPGHSRYVVDISDLVKGFTGQYRDQQVMELLNAAAEALGERHGFDLKTLIDLRHAKRRKPGTSK